MYGMYLQRAVELRILQVSCISQKWSIQQLDKLQGLNISTHLNTHTHTEQVSHPVQSLSTSIVIQTLFDHLNIGYVPQGLCTMVYDSTISVLQIGYNFIPSVFR